MSKTYPTSIGQAYNPKAFLAQQLKGNRSLQRAIMAAKDKLLKKPAKGFVAGNINVVFFLNKEFSFTLMGENGVRRVGRSLMRMWGEDYSMKANEATITSFLRWVGIEVAGEVARHPQDSHYQNNRHMKAAITADKNLVFEEDRFSVYDFLFGTFYFRDSEGTLFKFGGQTLYRKQGKGGLQKENVIALLREIGIEIKKPPITPPPIIAPPKPPVTVKTPPEPPKLPPLETLLADDDLVVPPIKSFIRRNRGKLLMHLMNGFQPSNIVRHQFPETFSATYNGEPVSFTLKELLQQRGYPNNTNGIAALFRELEIN